ncbi:MAG: hypothetical protein GQ582_01055, partial [Methyloprofundus sp.]|nr:hypothetical protein [Methyloprofundus sp.]
MNILTRASRLLKADIHGILESLEQPDIILQQSIRDMQDAIDKDQSNLSNLEAQQGQLQQKQ